MHRPALMRLALGVGLLTILMLAGPGLVHDGEAQALYTPGGELALSRDRVDLRHLFIGIRDLPE